MALPDSDSGSVVEILVWPFLTVTLRVSSRDSRVALPDSDSQGQ